VPVRTPGEFAQGDGGITPDSDPASRVGTESPAGMLSLSAGELLSCRPMAASSFMGMGFGLREGLKRCLRGMAVPLSY
jgi:hypothetical protein